MKYAFPGIVLLATLLFHSVPASACKSAGPNKHVGVVLSVNIQDHVIVIKDAENGDKMSFKAAQPLLKDIRVNQEVVITFEKNGTEMIATKITA